MIITGVEPIPLRIPFKTASKSDASVWGDRNLNCPTPGHEFSADIDCMCQSIARVKRTWYRYVAYWIFSGIA